MCVDAICPVEAGTGSGCCEFLFPIPWDTIINTVRIGVIMLMSVTNMVNLEFKKMKEEDYTPRPADTSHVVLPKELIELAEVISKNVHEVWAHNRMKEGWTYGEVCDDKKRQTPCLVPYEELSEEEKAYDRNTAFGTLKYILSLGFDIVKKE